MTLIRRLTFLTLALSALGAVQPCTASFAAATPIYDNSHGCINYVTSLPSIAGSGFRVYSPSVSLAKAKAVANIIQSHNVLQVYSNGLRIPSLKQNGQTGAFPVFVDPELRSEMSGTVDGVMSNICQHAQWAGVAVYPNLPPDELAATVYHELFHAAQGAVVHEAGFRDNWWFEASAVAAEAWFGSQQHKDYDPAVIQRPVKPMDTFNGLEGGGHEYGAYLFVQWAMQSANMPTAGQWAFLRKSILDVNRQGPDFDAGLQQALRDLSSSKQCDPAITALACNVASFWGDEIKPAPAFAQTARLQKFPVEPQEDAFTLPTAPLYGSRTFAFTPATDQQQVELVVPTLPTGVEVWVYLGKGKLQRIEPGDSFDKTFCRTGKTEDSIPLPETGDIRLAMTTTDANREPDVHFKTVSSTGACKSENGIMLFQQSVNEGKTPAVTFTSLTCKQTKVGTDKVFVATGKQGAYTLRVSIKPFTGYKRYGLHYQSSNPGFVVKGPGGPFSNLYWPGGTPPDGAGSIVVGETSLGIGAYNAFNPNASDSIALAGVAPCNLGAG